MKNISKVIIGSDGLINEIKACLEQKKFKVARSFEDFKAIIDEHEESLCDIHTVVIKLFDEP